MFNFKLMPSVTKKRREFDDDDLHNEISLSQLTSSIIHGPESIKIDAQSSAQALEFHNDPLGKEYTPKQSAYYKEIVRQYGEDHLLSQLPSDKELSYISYIVRNQIVEPDRAKEIGRENNLAEEFLDKIDKFLKFPNSSIGYEEQLALGLADRISENEADSIALCNKTGDFKALLEVIPQERLETLKQRKMIDFLTENDLKVIDVLKQNNTPEALLPLIESEETTPQRVRELSAKLKTTRINLIDTLNETWTKTRVTSRYTDPSFHLPGRSVNIISSTSLALEGNDINILLKELDGRPLKQDEQIRLKELKTIQKGSPQEYENLLIKSLSEQQRVSALKRIISREEHPEITEQDKIDKIIEITRATKENLTNELMSNDVFYFTELATENTSFSTVEDQVEAGLCPFLTKDNLEVVKKLNILERLPESNKLQDLERSLARGRETSQDIQERDKYRSLGMISILNLREKLALSDLSKVVGGKFDKIDIRKDASSAKLIQRILDEHTASSLLKNELSMSDKDFESFKRFHIGTLTKSQIEWILAGADESTAESFGLKTSEMYAAKKRVKFIYPGALIGCDTEGLPEVDATKLNRLVDEIGAEKTHNEREIAERYKSIYDEKMPRHFLHRLIYSTTPIPHTADLSVTITDKTVFEKDFAFNCKESLPLIELRSKRDINSPIKELSLHDEFLVMSRYSEGDFLPRRDIVRRAMLESSGNTLKSLQSVPNLDEYIALSKIIGRKFSTDEVEVLHDTVKKILSEDFNLREASIKRMLEKFIGFDQVRTKDSPSLSRPRDKQKKSQTEFIINTTWREPKSFIDYRCYTEATRRLNKTAHGYFLYETGLSAPPKDLTTLFLSNANALPSKFTQRLPDYEIACKIERNERLSYLENKRLNEVKLNGIHPLSTEFIEQIRSESSSHRLMEERKIALAKHYTKMFPISKKALLLTNKFKMVTEEGLIEMGIPKADIERMTTPIRHSESRVLSGASMANYFSLPDGTKAIQLSHETNSTRPTSGRKVVEVFYPDVVIKGFDPDRREDLNLHDSKILSCVAKSIKKVLEKDPSWKVKEIYAESDIQSLAKTNTPNILRAGGECYLDSLVIFEKEIELATGGTTTEEKTVGVEYGNYRASVMQHKLENTKFDEAYVYSKSSYQKIHSRNITVPRVDFVAMGR